MKKSGQTNRSPYRTKEGKKVLDSRKRNSVKSDLSAYTKRG